MKFILLVVDTYSRYLFARILPNKKTHTVVKAFEDILKETGYFHHLVTDLGKEYYNKDFQKLMKTHKINHYSPKTQSHASFVERLIRTLMGLIFKMIQKNKSNNFLPYFEEIVNSYNNRKHRIIGMSPAMAESGKFDDLLAENIKKMRNKVKKQYPVFKIGDKVRIMLPQAQFYKGYRQSASNEIFQIVKINTKHKIPLYSIKNLESGERIEGQFYKQELQKVSL